MLLIWVACAITIGYQLTALAASLRQYLRRPPRPASTPGLSVLKPVHGLDPDFEEALYSHFEQDYPQFEILFAAHDPADPALRIVRKVAANYPQVAVRILTGDAPAANGKVGLLIDAARHARYPVLLVNDADIIAPPGYFRTVTAPLADPSVALVTCLYRARAASAPGKWEALGIAVDFAPGVLVAPWVGVREFGLGATLAFRAADLAAIGGFESIADFLADDYQLAKRLSALGGRIVLSTTVVESSINDSSWSKMWSHQVRWARTIRVSRGGGYAGLPVTHSGLWALAAILTGAWSLALAVLLVRILAGLAAGWLVLRSPIALRAWPFIPVWDLWAFAVWIAGLFGRTVEWRGRSLCLDAEGRITSSTPSSPSVRQPL
jgi:ceramide glucosyltransferase